ncbi:hypothetical protein [Halogeometricum sp. CBA1124]|uniref:hypothetical protein n=1 Tax=Halogeometricum sp. CBA1124 TaxID=2668071 RepID=UPI00142CD45E|nr:hypothetical protein [Halogeometricum sp. CBA1124]MUV56225.1 hypothetical protein [Halogeometricum sp. CBA1124]
MIITAIEEMDGIADSIKHANVEELDEQLSSLAHEFDGWTYSVIDFKEYPSLLAVVTTEEETEPARKTVVGVAPSLTSAHYVVPFLLQGHDVKMAVMDVREDGITEETIREWRPEPAQKTLLKLGVVPIAKTTLKEAVACARGYCEIVG